MMSINRAALAAVLLVAGACAASAQTPPAQTPPTVPGATSGTSGQMEAEKPTTPLPGANSFTESQAKARMESAGVSEVANLRKDEAGVWRAYAKQGGKQVNVALDFRGNVIVSQ